METNVDLGKLKSAKWERRRELIKEWAFRLASRYSDPAALKAQLDGLFEDVGDYLSDDDLRLLYDLDLADRGDSDRPRSGREPQDEAASRSVAAERHPQRPTSNYVEREQEAIMEPRSAPSAAPLADRPIVQTSNVLHASGDIGRLVKVSPSEVWRTSKFDISNWLVDNSDIAKEVLGFELRKIPGGFSGGAPTIEDASGRKVLIVSHLNETSDDRLGDFIVRMASSRAQLGIWIVTGTRRQDIDAIDWLIGLGAYVFLIQLEAVRIATSPPAPLLALITGPRPDIQSR